MLSQTPQFTLKIDPSDSAHDVGVHIDMTVHHGVIKSFDFGSNATSTIVVEKVRSLIMGKRLQDIHDWRQFLRSNIPGEVVGTASVADALEEYLPIPGAPPFRDFKHDGLYNVERAGKCAIAG